MVFHAVAETYVVEFFHCCLLGIFVGEAEELQGKHDVIQCCQ